METLTIVHPQTNAPLGIMRRADAIKQRVWCRSTNVFVMNTKGEILCHQRSPQKERLPGVWCTHLGGHVGSDESYEENARKELSEEAGINVDASALIPWRTTKLERARLWVREFVVLVDKQLHELVPQPGEVEQFAWLSPHEILDRANVEQSLWCAGTHDFAVEYHCLRTALAVAAAQGIITTEAKLDTWEPLLDMY